MPKLSIDIGIDLKDSLGKLNGLKTALMDVEKTANNLVSSLQKIGGVKINPQVSQPTGASPVSSGSIQPKVSKLPDIFAEYNSGAIKASSLSDFLQKKLNDLGLESTRLRSILSTTQDPNVYNATIQKLKEVEKQTKQVSIALNAQNPNISATTGNYTKFNAVLDKQRQVANLANLSLVNTGRIFQDLPYGILGVSNNINPLVEGFSQLSQTAKSTGQSMTSVLLKSLTGAGGLAFGFSLVTAALGFASVGLSYWARNSDKAKANTDSLSNSLKKQNDELNRNYESITKSAGEELSRVIELKKVIESEVTSRERRIAAIKELKSISPEIFGQLEKEKVSVEALDNSYKNFINTLKLQVQTQRIRAKLTQETEKLINAEQKLASVKFSVEDKDITVIFNPDSVRERIEIIKKYGAKAEEAFRFFDKEKAKAFSGAKNKEIEYQTKVINNLVSEYDKLVDGVKLVNGVKVNIETPEVDKSKVTAPKPDKQKELTELQKYQLAIAEIRADILKIQQKPLLTEPEKNVAIANLLKSSLDKLSDDFPKQFKTSLNQVGGDVRQFTDKLSQTQLTIFSDATLKNAEDFANALSNIKLDEEITGLDKTKELINVSRNALKGFRKEKDDLLATPFRLEGLPQFAIAFGQIDKNIKTATESLAFFQEQLRQQQIADIFKGAADKAKELEREFRALSKNLPLEKRLKIRLETDKKDLDDVQKRIADLNLLKINPLDPDFIELLKKEQRLIFKIDADTKNLEAAANLAQSYKDFLSESFADVGDAIGTALSEGTDVAAAIGKTLLENFGAFLQKVGKEFILASKLIQTAQSFIATPLGLAAGVALVALGALVKGIAAKGFADGGFVSGPGSSRSDSIPARLSNGEYVINAKSVRKYGKGFFDNLNSGAGRFSSQFNGLMKYADGGLVTGSSRGTSRAIVNRFEAPQIIPYDKSRALVNRSEVLSMGESFQREVPYIAETKISGQDLKLVLKRADNKYSNVT